MKDIERSAYIIFKSWLYKSISRPINLTIFFIVNVYFVETMSDGQKNIKKQNFYSYFSFCFSSWSYNLYVDHLTKETSKYKFAATISKFLLINIVHKSSLHNKCFTFYFTKYSKNAVVKGVDSLHIAQNK